MRRRLGKVLTIALLAASVVQPAMACGWAPSSDIAAPAGEAYAAALFGAAAKVDLAVAVRADPIDMKQWVDGARAHDVEDDDHPMFGRPAREQAARDLVKLGAASMAFRGVERLKGDGPVDFHFYGFWSNSRRQPQEGAFDKAIALYELWPTAFVSGCARSIAARRDGLYLIFRDADGRLLNAQQVKAEPMPGEPRGRPFERIDAPDDPWLAAVRRVAMAL